MGLLASMTGCHLAPKDEKKKEVVKKPSIPVQVVNLSPGSSTQYGPGASRPIQWIVQWKKAAQADVSVNGASHARMEDVAGQVFSQSKERSRFSADYGFGDAGLQQLELRGHVHVTSRTEAAELFADRLVFDAQLNVLRAQGHVRAVGSVGTVGTLSEIWATPDLKTVATPEMFDSPSAP